MPFINILPVLSQGKNKIKSHSTFSFPGALSMSQPGNQEAVYLETGWKGLCTWTPGAWLDCCLWGSHWSPQQVLKLLQSTSPISQWWHRHLPASCSINLKWFWVICTNSYQTSFLQASHSPLWWLQPFSASSEEKATVSECPGKLREIHAVNQSVTSLLVIKY